MERSWDEYFKMQGVTNEDAESLVEVREWFQKLALGLQEKLPEGRYKSLVRTKLEEAAMFATKSFSLQ